jgi:hypothetical protein
MGTTPRDTATLFDDIRRVDTSYASRAESSFGFLNRTAIAELGGVRPVLEGWFARFSRIATARPRLSPCSSSTGTTSNVATMIAGSKRRSITRARSFMPLTFDSGSLHS